MNLFLCLNDSWQFCSTVFEHFQRYLYDVSEMNDKTLLLEEKYCCNLLRNIQNAVHLCKQKTFKSFEQKENLSLF